MLLGSDGIAYVALGWAKRAIQMRLSPVESVLLAACVVMAVVVMYWGIKILTA